MQRRTSSLLPLSLRTDLCRHDDGGMGVNRVDRKPGSRSRGIVTWSRSVLMRQSLWSERLLENAVPGSSVMD